MKKNKILISVLAGIVCFALSPVGIVSEWGDIVIDIPWAIILPFLVSMAFGWRYALVVSISGGAIYPFYLWYGNGFTCLTTSLVYTLSYVLLGLINNKKLINTLGFYYVRLLLLLVSIIFVFYIYYTYLFEYFLSLNPPFWNKTSIQYLHQEVIQSFFIKDSINYLTMLILSTTLLKLPFVRKILLLKTASNTKHNHFIFITSILVSCLIWSLFYLLADNLIPDKGIEHKHYLSLAFYVIVFSNVVVSRVIIEYSERNLQNLAKISENETLLETLLNTIPDLVWLKDTHGIYLKCNKRFELFFGKSETEIIGKTDYDFVNKELADFFRANDWHALRSGEPVKNEEEIVYQSDKHKEMLETIKAPLRINNTIVGILGIGRNITDRKQNEDELRKAKEKAEESDQLKTAFLQNMSHEIRTPMNAIIGFSSLLSSNLNSKEKLEKFSKIIELRCNDLLDIINEILDISKIESGQSTINVENCNVNELFDELFLFFNDYKRRINKQDIELQFLHLPEKALFCIKTDKVKLKQILINLVSNAFKFIEKGSVTCGYCLEQNKLKFYVSDTGIGIPADKFEYIFERFSQLKHSSAQNVGGTGLGLPIVKGLVKLLGGEVWLESECQKGTTFYFTIDHIVAE